MKLQDTANYEGEDDVVCLDEAYLAGNLINAILLSVRHTLRFWNAAFFDAVHCERKKRSPTTR